MTKNKGTLTVFIVSATVFFSNACIMIVELVASRLIARHLGSSLYTWTSIIGIVLAGISIGNYFGGRLADKYNPRKTLSVLFMLASVACVAIIFLNNIVGEWIWLWQLSWPVRVFSHVSLVFLLPSMLLGTISPVAATMALKSGLPTGRTIGEIYAWAAVGSIAGTFLAGFYLIASIGTIAIIWVIAGALLAMGIIYYAKMWILYIWAVIFGGLLTLGMAPYEETVQLGGEFKLREKYDSSILYQDETPYCWVAVKQISQDPDRREFIQDKLKHSEIDMGNSDNLLYFYTHIYASITQGLRPAGTPITAMVIGGGGYVYPKYLDKLWPHSRIDVVEIDPGVTEAAHAAFGLPRDTTINTISLDARNYVDNLLADKQAGKPTPVYDFIYEDAINDYSVPFQLVTQEFNQKIVQLLKPDGVYLVNLIEVYNSGFFLGSMIQTLEKTFPHVYVLTERAPHSIRNTFVLAASFIELDLKGIIGNYTRGSEIWYLANDEINGLKQKSKYGIITDDYAPVENMLASVVKRSGADYLAMKYKKQAQELKLSEKYNESIQSYLNMIKTEPTLSTLGYNEIGLMLAQQGKSQEAIGYFLKAIDYNQQSDAPINLAAVHLNTAFLLRDIDNNQAQEHFRQAADGFKKELGKDEKSLKNTMLLANTLKEMGNFKEAIEYFKKAVDLNPYDIQQHITLAQTYESLNDYDNAIAAIEKAIGFFAYINETPRAEPLKQYLDFLKYKKQNISKTEN